MVRSMEIEPKRNTAILLMKVLSRVARGINTELVQVGGNKFKAAWRVTSASRPRTSAVRSR